MSTWRAGQSVRTCARWLVDGVPDVAGPAWARYSTIVAGVTLYLQEDDTWAPGLHEFDLSSAVDGLDRFFVFPGSPGALVVETARHATYGFNKSAEHDYRDGQVLDAIKLKTDLLGAGMQVTVVSPISGGASLTLVRGDDYFAAQGRSIDFANVDGDWPDLTDATVRLAVRALWQVAEVFTVDGTVVTPTGSGQLVRFEIPTEKTSLLYGNELRAPGPGTAGRGYIYEVEATIHGKIAVLVLGPLEAVQP